MGVEDLSVLSSDYRFVDPEKTVNEKHIVPFATLQHLESRRRRILKRTELPFWRILGYFEGTCLKAMSVDWLLWVTLGVYVSLRIILRDDNILPGFKDFGDTDITVIGGFLSFFLVLFVNQSNGRFYAMYKTSMSCPSIIYDVAQIATPMVPAATASRLIRYMNAAHVAGYVGLSRTYSEEEFFNKLNEQFQFLDKKELERVRELKMNDGPEAFHELISWCMADVEDACLRNEMEGREKKGLKDKIAHFREKMDDLYDYCDQPVHFFYIHFLCLLSAVYLPLFAASNAFDAGSGDNVHWSWDVLSGLVVLVQAIFVIGLRLLGQKMSDPYGDDLEDLSVLHYVTEAWKTSNEMLLSRRPYPEVSAEAEESLSKGRSVKLGPAFEVSTTPPTKTGIV